MEVVEEDWPWVFAKSQKASRVISTLEALAVPVALKLETSGGSRTRVRIAPTLTGNRGNGAALNKLMTTKFPASGLLVELSWYTKKMSVRTVVEWTPREGNREADKLANGTTRRSTWPCGYQSVSPVSWEILPEALLAGRTAEEHFQTAKVSGRVPDRTTKQRKRKVDERLKATDPW